MINNATYLLDTVPSILLNTKPDKDVLEKYDNWTKFQKDSNKYVTLVTGIKSLQKNILIAYMLDYFVSLGKTVDFVVGSPYDYAPIKYAIAYLDADMVSNYGRDRIVTSLITHAYSNRPLILEGESFLTLESTLGSKFMDRLSDISVEVNINRERRRPITI